MVGSFFGEPGDVAELPGVLVAAPAGVVVPHPKPWRLSADAGGATPLTAMATMQLAVNSLCLMFALRFRARATAHPSGDMMSMGTWFKPIFARRCLSSSEPVISGTKRTSCVNV
jgi:hypothetical protein